MRLTINFKDIYKEEFQHAEAQDNTSRYICELIRKDLKGKDDMEERILSIINNIPKNTKEKVSNTKKKALENMFEV